MINDAGISLNEKDSDVFFIKSEFNLRYAFAKNHCTSVIASLIELKYSWSTDNITNYWLFNLGFWF
jgi:hypothetical protein